LGDRIGEARTITICLALSGLSTLIMLVAGAMHAIIVYALALTLMAVWASFYHPTANSLISKTFKGKVSESMGWHGMGGTIGTVMTPAIAWFIGVNYGWPWAFVVFGVICVLLALLFARGFGKSEKKDDTRGSIIDALKIRELWVLLIFNVAIGLFMKGVELYFPLYTQDNKLVGLGLSDAERGMWASLAFTLLLGVGVPAQLIGGKAADKIGSKKVLIATSTGVVLSLISLVLFPIAVVGVILFVVLYGLSFYAHQPALNALTGFCCPPSQRGAVYGIFFFTSFGIGSLSQVIAGFVATQFNFDAAFYLLIAFALAALVLSFMLPEKRETS
jgi:MFS family permease